MQCQFMSTAHTPREGSPTLLGVAPGELSARSHLSEPRVSSSRRLHAGIDQNRRWANAAPSRKEPDLSGYDAMRELARTNARHRARKDVLFACLSLAIGIFIAALVYQAMAPFAGSVVFLGTLVYGGFRLVRGVWAWVRNRS